MNLHSVTVTVISRTMACLCPGLCSHIHLRHYHYRLPHSRLCLPVPVTISSFLTDPGSSFIPAADTTPPVKYGLRSTLSPMTCKYSALPGRAGYAGFRTRLAPLRPSKPIQKRRIRDLKAARMFPRSSTGSHLTACNIHEYCSAGWGETDAVLTRRARRSCGAGAGVAAVSRIAPVWPRRGSQMRHVCPQVLRPREVAVGELVRTRSDNETCFLLMAAIVVNEPPVHSVTHNYGRQEQYILKFTVSAF